MTFAAIRIRPWRRKILRRRCFETCARFLLPCPRIRRLIGRWLRLTFPFVARFARTQLGMIFFDRIVIPKFTRDTGELRSYGTDIRQILCENALTSRGGPTLPFTYKTKED